MRPFYQCAVMKDSAGGRGLRRDVGAARGDCLLGGPPGEAPRGRPSGRGLPAGSLSPGRYRSRTSLPRLRRSTRSARRARSRECVTATTHRPSSWAARTM